MALTLMVCLLATQIALSYPKFVGRDELFVVKDQVLPETLFKRVMKEVDYEYTVNRGSRFVTLERVRKPRTAIEEAMQHFLFQDFPHAHDRQQVGGGEFWIHGSDGAGGKYNHIDKDEMMVQHLNSLFFQCSLTHAAPHRMKNMGFSSPHFSIPFYTSLEKVLPPQYITLPSQLMWTAGRSSTAVVIRFQGRMSLALSFQRKTAAYYSGPVLYMAWIVSVGNFPQKSTAGHS